MQRQTTVPLFNAAEFCMYCGYRCVGMIPARGGSKGLPGKNIRELCGKPLLAWTIEAALSSELLDRVVVSTDSAQIADVARQYGADAPFLRPADLAQDASPTMGAVDHLLDFFDARDERFDYLALLEPTSPLREDGDIDRMIRSLVDRRTDFDSIISLGPVSEQPAHLKRLDGERYSPYCSDLPQGLRRQDYDTAYFPYGVAYIAKVEALRSERSFYTRRSTHFEIGRHQTYEIDDIYDFITVEAIMRYRWGER